MLNRRVILGLAGLCVPAAGAVVYAGQTGRINLFNPALPEDADLPALAGVSFGESPVKGLNRSAFFKGVSLLNVWASWCPDCRSEHAALMQLAQRPGIEIYGLATDDTVANAGAYLRQHGNPYVRVSLDSDRRYQRALKHRGVPQTYVFDARGQVVARISGALTQAIIDTQLLPVIDKARMAA